MFFGFMNQREKAEYDRMINEYLKDKADAFGRVSEADRREAERVAMHYIKLYKKNGLL